MLNNGKEDALNIEFNRSTVHTSFIITILRETNDANNPNNQIITHSSAQIHEIFAFNYFIFLENYVPCSLFAIVHSQQTMRHDHGLSQLALVYNPFAPSLVLNPVVQLLGCRQFLLLAERQHLGSLGFLLLQVRKAIESPGDQKKQPSHHQ